MYGRIKTNNLLNRGIAFLIFQITYTFDFKNVFFSQCENLQNSLDNFTKELKDKEQQIKDTSRCVEILEEDLVIFFLYYIVFVRVLVKLNEKLHMLML